MAAKAKHGRGQPQHLDNFARDELRLADIVKVLFQRWKWIAGVCGVATMISVVIVMRMPAYYGVSTVISIPDAPIDPSVPTRSRRGISNLIEEFEEVKSVIPLIIAPRTRPTGSGLPGAGGIKLEQASPSVFTVVMQVRLQAIPAGKKWITEITKQVIVKWADVYRRHRASAVLEKERIVRRISSLEIAVDALKKERVNAKTLVARAGIDDQLRLTISEIKQSNVSITALNNAISALTPKFGVVEPVATPNPVAPNRKLLIGIGFIVAVILGVLAAFVRDFWVTHKEFILDANK